MPLFNNEQYNIYQETIGALYECNALEDLYTIMLTHLPRLIDFDSAVLLDFDQDGITVRSGLVQDLEPGLFESYSSYYQHHDIYKQIVNEMPTPPSVEQASQFIEYSEWKHNGHRSEFLIPQGIYHIACLNLQENNKVALTMSMHRNKRHSDFDDREIEILRILIPNFQAAYQALRLLTDGKVPAWLSDLTARELHILPYILSDIPNDKISIRLGISPNTLKTHIRRILSKSQCGSRFDLVIRYGEAIAASSSRELNNGLRKRA